MKKADTVQPAFYLLLINGVLVCHGCFLNDSYSLVPSGHNTDTGAFDHTDDKLSADDNTPWVAVSQSPAEQDDNTDSHTADHNNHSQDPFERQHRLKEHILQATP